MNTGRSLTDLAAELERQVKTRKDYLAPQGKLGAVVVENDNGREVVIDGFNDAPAIITPYAHSQLADHLGIPKRYYDRMAAERPSLLAENINSWFQADPDNKRMLRTLDGKVRAVLSPRYRPLDNYDLANAVLPTLIENEVQVVSTQLTETRMYIKGILPRLSDELAPGKAWGTGHDILQGHDRGKLVAAITISNSDIGAGSLRVEPSVFTTFCTNLAILAQAAMKKHHVGRSTSSDDSYEVFRDETRQADDRAFWMKVRDITVSAFDEQAFRAAVAQLREKAEVPITSEDLPAVVERTVEVLSLPVGSQNGILKALAAGGDFSQWGLSSALTRVAGSIEDYETATALERAGGSVLVLPEKDWTSIATAAA